MHKLHHSMIDLTMEILWEGFVLKDCRISLPPDDPDSEKEGKVPMRLAM